MERVTDSLGAIIAEAQAGSERIKPYIIGIGGGAGVGKTTFSAMLSVALEGGGKKVLVISLDDFIKSPEERASLGTEWDERHINLAEARRVLGSVRRGESEIRKPKYNRATKAVETECINAFSLDIVLFEGIYAISSEKRLGNFLEFVDLPVFMSAKIADIKAWRFGQENKKPHPRTKEEMERHWNLGILPDLSRNILPSERNARFVIDVGSDRTITVSKHIIPRG